MIESVRQCFMNFALSFLVVADSDVVSAILELKGKCPNPVLRVVINTMQCFIYVQGR